MVRVGHSSPRLWVWRQSVHFDFGFDPFFRPSGCGFLHILGMRPLLSISPFVCKIAAEIRSKILRNQIGSDPGTFGSIRVPSHGGHVPSRGRRRSTHHPRPSCCRPAPSGAVVVVAFILPMEPGGREMVANWLQKRSTTLRYAIEVPA